MVTQIFDSLPDEPTWRSLKVFKGDAFIGGCIFAKAWYPMDYLGI